MSLIRQIWLLLLGALLLAFGGGLAVAVGTASGVVEDHLREANAAEAAALAAALAPLASDPAAVQRLLAARADTGRFLELRFTPGDGGAAFAHAGGVGRTQAPRWFVALLPLRSAPADAPLGAGAPDSGRARVALDTAPGHDALWSLARRAAVALAVLAGVPALLGAWFLARLRRGLGALAHHARALADGRLVTVPEPALPGFGEATRAMNALVTRLRQGFEAQAAQVEALRREAHTDPVSGLANRQHFMRQLAGLLPGEGGMPESGLVLMRVHDLAGTNRLLGRAATDRMIAALAQALQAYTERAPGCRLGRLNGSDFALALPAGGVALETGQAVAQALGAVLPAFGPGLSVAVGVAETRREMTLAQLLGAADAALARAESQGPFAVVAADPGDAGGGPAALGEAAWRQRISRALLDDRLRLAAFPVLDAQARPLHLECPLRLQLDPDGPYESAARWLPLALRGRLTALVDERAVALALAAIARDGAARAVNLCGASLADSGFASRLRDRLAAAGPSAHALWLELPEAAALEHADGVRELARQLRPTGCRVGLEHAGEGLARLEGLVESGLQFVKLDAALVQGIAADAGRQHFLQSLVAMLHGLAMVVVAEGVVDPADAQALWALGLDGVAGPWASARRRDLVDPGQPPA